MTLPPSDPLTSIVVPTHNRGALLPMVVSALVDQDEDEPYEIVVVDDGSSDSTPQILAELANQHGDMVRFSRQESAGPAKARNLGARLAHGRILAFIDDDCVAERSWLRRVRQRLSVGDASAMIGPIINREPNWVGRYINRESVFGAVGASPSRTFVLTGNFAVLSAVFAESGGFDEAIRVAGGEDTEFGLRLESRGQRIAWLPEARVHHQTTFDILGYLRMIHRHGRGRRRLGQRFPAYGIRWPWLALLWVLWPVRRWMVLDFRRYRAAGVPSREALKYVLLRYLENPSRVSGYIRGS